MAVSVAACLFVAWLMMVKTSTLSLSQVLLKGILFLILVEKFLVHDFRLIPMAGDTEHPELVDTSCGRLVSTVEDDVVVWMD
jgi:hypothetical protein